MLRQSGKVYLLGAGLGHPAFMTLRGQQLLQQADVVIYDALIDPQLLTYCSSHCGKIDVGKRGNRPSTPQSEINRLLVDYCQQGRQVVRLKSGDPLIFGRTASEVGALQAAGCPYEVWPGLSSALAAPLCAGIPLTDAVWSNGFMVVSGHALDRWDWELLSRTETLVILMGGKSLVAIAQGLQNQGKSAQTPIAVIRWGGWSQQQVWVSTLGDIGQQTEGESLSPAVVVVGEVVRLRDMLQIPAPQLNLKDFRETVLTELNPGNHSMCTSVDASGRSPLPLQNRTILVTRSAGQAPEFSERLRSLGATVIEMPTLEIGPPSSWAALDGAIAQLTTFDWLILTSANAVQFFFERLHQLGQDARSLAGVKIAVVGRKTATFLKQQGLQPDFIPPNYIADDLVNYFPERHRLAGMSVLFPRVETGGREVLVAQFTEAGATVVEIPAYQSGCPSAIAPQALEALRNRQVDVVTFASSKTVEHFCQLLDRAIAVAELPDANWHTWLDAVRIASIGPQTSQTCQKRLGRVDVEAREYTLEGLAQSIAEHEVHLS